MFNFKKEKKVDNIEKTTNKISQKDKKAQQKAIKEIENFLNYNGEEQDDI